MKFYSQCSCLRGAPWDTPCHPDRQRKFRHRDAGDRAGHALFGAHPTRRRDTRSPIAPCPPTAHRGVPPPSPPASEGAWLPPIPPSVRAFRPNDPDQGVPPVDPASRRSALITLTNGSLAPLGTPASRGFAPPDDPTTSVQPLDHALPSPPPYFLPTRGKAPRNPSAAVRRRVAIAITWPPRTTDKAVATAIGTNRPHQRATPVLGHRRRAADRRSRGTGRGPRKIPARRPSHGGTGQPCRSAPPAAAGFGVDLSALCRGWPDGRKGSAP